MLVTHPGFQLYSAALHDTVLQGVMRDIFLPNMLKTEIVKRAQLSLNMDSVPIGLRWTTHPEIGFSRKPFSVYRRRARYSAESIIRVVNGTNEVVNLYRAFYFTQETYVMAVSFTVTAGQSLTITPLGRDNVLLKAKQITATTSGTVMFKAPFMIGVLCEGMGSVTSLAAVTMESVLNASDWQLIQYVGFPFKSGDIGGLGYQGDPQGFVGALTSGPEAAELRLRMGEWLFLKPPSINAADPQCPDVTWKHPDATAYLNYLGQEQLQHIAKCLTQSNDFSWLRSERQIGFNISTTINGISQSGSGLPPKPATVVIPVVKQTLLSVSNECPAALGLGFGTYDFVSARTLKATGSDYSYMAAANYSMYAASSASSFLGYDYMVTGEFVIRPFEEFELPFLDSVSEKVVFAALNDERAQPVTPTQLESMGIQMNRPVQRDLAYTESVKVRWQQGHVPHGFGMVSNYKPGVLGRILNDDYPFGSDIYKNFFTPVPKVDGVEQDLGDIGKFVLTESDEPLPFSGSELHKYLIAGWDVFGRWTNWAKINYMAYAPPPQQPGILAIRLQVANPDGIYTLAPNAPLVEGKLEIEFGWDWIDRTPDEIQIAGKFFNASLVTPPAGANNFFALGASDTATPVISINFTSTNPVVLPTTNRGTIHIMQSNAPSTPVTPVLGSSDIPSNHMVRYKLIVDVQCSFPTGAPFEVAYAAAIRGKENVRPDFSPWSNELMPKPIYYISRLADPRPPSVVTLPAEVKLTAVPDATKLGRGRLTWPAAVNAAAYHVWEASETAIRTTLDKILKAEFPGDASKHLLSLNESFVSRATQLRDLLAQTKYAAPCQRYFNRITKDPIPNTFYELALPGGADVMFLYQVSSVNSANIESNKSNPIFFAVPRVIKPAPPMIQVRPYKKKLSTDPDGEGIEVKVVTTTGDTPKGYQLYRTRKKIIGSDVGTKGLPVYEELNSAWTNTSIEMLDGTTYPGRKVRELGISRSWRPYVYQAVAVGQDDNSRGRLSGLSDGSSTELFYFPPASAPTMVLVTSSSNSFSNLFVLQTSAPFDKLELGYCLIEVFELDSANERTLLKSFVAHETKQSTTPLALAASTTEADVLPEVNHQPTNLSTGITQFSVCVKGDPVKIIVKITDPLNRATEIKLGA